MLKGIVTMSFFISALCKLNSQTNGFRVTSNFFGEFDSGSERTLAAWIRHASRTILLNLEAARPMDSI